MTIIACIHGTITMFGLTTATSGSGALPPAGQQVRLQQSRQAAERAEQVARDLRQQADAAQQDADRSQSTARSLGSKADQAESRASQVRKGTPVLDNVAMFSAEGPPKVSAVSNQDTPPPATADKPAQTGNTRAASGVLNLSGQRLGQVIDVAV